MEGPVLRGGLLFTEQDCLPGGLSREGSMTERGPPAGGAAPLTAAVRDNWVPSEAGPASHPLPEHEQEAQEVATAPADIEDEFEGVCAANASSDEYSDVGEGAAAADTQVVFVKEGVCVFPTASRRQRILGRLSLIRQCSDLWICWLPYAAGAVQPAAGGGLGGAAAANGGPESAKDRTMYAVHPIPVSDVRAIHKHTPPLGQHRVTLTLASGVSLPSLHFQSGGVKSFLSCLRQHARLERSTDDPNTYLINNTADPLQRSLYSLELADAVVGAPHAGAAFPQLAGPLAGHAPDGDGGLLDAGRAHLSELVDRFQQLTQNARLTASTLFAGGSVLLGAAGGPPEPHLGAAASAASGLAAAAGGGGGSLGAQEGQPRGSAEVSGELGAFELVDGGTAAGAGGASPHAKPRGPPLSLAELHTFFDAEGRLANAGGFRQRVRDGGVEADARPEAWKLLLGLHAAGSTRAERQAEVERRRSAYQALRGQWRSMAPAQQAKCSKWRERRARIDKDVRRTDRGHRFFARERGQAQHMLRSVLLSYERYNQDLGYVQGMSDLAAPCLYVMRGAVAGGGQLSNAGALAVEAEAFWAFAALMERMEPNFSSDSRAMHAQLLALRSLVQLLDPPLHAHLAARDCLSYFYCYRWLLIWFKREFGFEEVLRLWEALWAARPGLHLFLCVAVLTQHRRRILAEDWDFDGMLKFCVELSHKLRLEPLLRDAAMLVDYAGEAGQHIVADALAGGAAGE